MKGEWVTEILRTGTAEDLERAVEVAVGALRGGEVVGLPTETVYGLAADGLNEEAVAKIFEVKERPYFDPLILHLPGVEWLERLVEMPEASEALVGRLVKRFWPGPLTMVLPRRAVVPDLVTAGRETVAVRMSGQAIFRAVVEGFGGPLAAPSANRFGRISPTSAEDVRSELGGRMGWVVDGGATEYGVESTIVAVEGEGMRILRAGPIGVEELREEGEVVEWNGERSGGGGGGEEAPGQTSSHYAPRTRLILVDRASEVSEEERVGAGLLGWKRGGEEEERGFGAVEWLSEAGDLREVAAGLFAKMRRLDGVGLRRIYAERVEAVGIGVAVMDRLNRAAFGEEKRG